MILKIGQDQPLIDPTAFVHPTAEISGKVIIGPRASVWGGCILRGDIEPIEIGEDSNVQDGCIFHTSHKAPVRIEKGVTVGHRALIHGATVQSYSLIGMAAVLMDHAVVEKNCLIGAGTLVNEKAVIPSGRLAVGSPAKVKRPLTPQEIQDITNRATDYVKYAKIYWDALDSKGL